MLFGKKEDYSKIPDILNETKSELKEFRKIFIQYTSFIRFLIDIDDLLSYARVFVYNYNIPNPGNFIIDHYRDFIPGHLNKNGFNPDVEKLFQIDKFEKLIYDLNYIEKFVDDWEFKKKIKYVLVNLELFEKYFKWLSKSKSDILELLKLFDIYFMHLKKIGRNRYLEKNEYQKLISANKKVFKSSLIRELLKDKQDHVLFFEECKSIMLSITILEEKYAKLKDKHFERIDISQWYYLFHFTVKSGWGLREIKDFFKSGILRPCEVKNYVPNVESFFPYHVSFFAGYANWQRKGYGIGFILDPSWVKKNVKMFRYNPFHQTGIGSIEEMENIGKFYGMEPITKRELYGYHGTIRRAMLEYEVQYSGNVPAEAIIGLVIRDSKLAQKLISLMSVSFKKNSSKFIPIYNWNGELIWPL